jgi:hypothetical protein
MPNKNTMTPSLSPFSPPQPPDLDVAAHAQDRARRDPEGVVKRRPPRRRRRNASDPNIDRGFCCRRR